MHDAVHVECFYVWLVLTDGRPLMHMRTRMFMNGALNAECDAACVCVFPFWCEMIAE